MAIGWHCCKRGIIESIFFSYFQKNCKCFPRIIINNYFEKLYCSAIIILQLKFICNSLNAQPLLNIIPSTPVVPSTCVNRDFSLSYTFGSIRLRSYIPQVMWTCLWRGDIRGLISKEIYILRANLSSLRGVSSTESIAIIF